MPVDSVLGRKSLVALLTINPVILFSFFGERFHRRNIINEIHALHGQVPAGPAAVGSESPDLQQFFGCDDTDSLYIFIPYL